MAGVHGRYYLGMGRLVDSTWSAGRRSLGPAVGGARRLEPAVGGARAAAPGRVGGGRRCPLQQK